MKFILEGIDRLGKSTLAENIQHKLGYHLVIHYDKPKKLRYLEHAAQKVNEGVTQSVKNACPLKIYQHQVNAHMFELISEFDGKIIFDRGHLGECVYAPLYRNYSGDYVFEYEKSACLDDAKLILLTTSNFDICVDDGESFNFDNKEKEQNMFIDAFNKSSMNKIMIDVYDPKTKGFKDPEVILKEALGAYYG